MKKKPRDLILFLFKPSINETYMTLSDRVIRFILMKQIFDYDIDGSLSVSEYSNVRTVSVGLASTWPSVEKRITNRLGGIFRNAPYIILKSNKSN